MLLPSAAIDGSFVFGFAPGRSDPETIYPGSAANMVVRTSDGGDGWDVVVEE